MFCIQILINTITRAQWELGLSRIPVMQIEEI